MSQARSPDTSRPRRALSRERVLAAALALVDREGLDARMYEIARSPELAKSYAAARMNS